MPRRPLLAIRRLYKPVSVTHRTGLGHAKRKLENGEQRLAPQSHQFRAESPEFARQRLGRASVTRAGWASRDGRRQAASLDQKVRIRQQRECRQFSHGQKSNRRNQQMSFRKAPFEKLLRVATKSSSQRRKQPTKPYFLAQRTGFLLQTERDCWGLVERTRRSWDLPRRL